MFIKPMHQIIVCFYSHTLHDEIKCHLMKLGAPTHPKNWNFQHKVPCSQWPHSTMEGLYSITKEILLGLYNTWWMCDHPSKVTLQRATRHIKLALKRLLGVDPFSVFWVAIVSWHPPSHHKDGCYMDRKHFLVVFMSHS